MATESLQRRRKPKLPPTKSYVIPCPAWFRDKVIQLAEQQDASIADLIRGVRLLLPPAALDKVLDPGDPGPDDRETITLKSGREAEKSVRRKPRLQARLEPGISVKDMRKALSLCLLLDEGSLTVAVETAGTPKHDPAAAARIEGLQEEIDRLRLILTTLAFDPLPNGVMTRSDALYVLGFQPTARPDRRTIQAKFRMLALIFHPDATTGDTQRMAQLNEAQRILKGL